MSLEYQKDIIVNRIPEVRILMSLEYQKKISFTACPSKHLDGLQQTSVAFGVFTQRICYLELPNVLIFTACTGIHNRDTELYLHVN